MRHVDEQLRSDGVGDAPEGGKVDMAGIGRTAGDDDLGPVLVGEALHLVHVEQVILFAHRIVHRVEPLAGLIDARPVGQVAAGREVQAQKGVAGLHQRHEHGLVGLAAGVRLDIGVFAVEQFLGPRDRDVLRLVHMLASAVVAPPGIALGVLVGHHRALRVEHRLAHDVLGGDQLDLVALAPEFAGDRAEKLGVGFRGVVVKEQLAGRHGSACNVHGFPPIR